MQALKQKLSPGTEAEKTVEEISAAVRNSWERTAESYRLSRDNIERMRPAFSQCYK